ncbi:MAG: L,D-transpeptidase family protein [Pseudomonadota bacterium]
MKQRKLIGSALGLALSATALASCSRDANQADQSSAGSADADGQVSWNSKLEQQLKDAIAQAPANGLRPDLFLQGDLPSDATQRRQVLTQAVLRYAQALSQGYSDPSQLWEVYTIPRPKADVRQAFAQAARNGNVGQWLASLTPQTDEYRALSQAHLRYLQLANRSKFQPVPDGKPIKPGAADPRVPAVAAALRSVGYLNPPSQPQQAGAVGPRQGGAQAQPAKAPSNLYSPELVTAVKQLQAEFGFKADGVIGGHTLDALNAGPAYRARQLAVAMERLRWLQRDPPGTRIDVNTAAAMLDYWRDGRQVDRRRVVVGQPKWATPQLQAPIVSLVANPAWRLPDNIVEDELAKNGPGYLEKKGIVQKDGRYIQPPGPKNALGLLKFDMLDDQSIYLHDTPEKALFSLDERHRSHGCVRVFEALQFGGAIAQEQRILDRLKQALASGEERFLKLPKAIPVRLLYHTAFWDGSRVQFRPDVYGWDMNVARALKLAAGQPIRQPQPEGDDLGP